ncbi:glycine--tRNA ligase subunit beta [Orrella sp. 11846]|uniref:glycine--tRNA ligase subunit beta n=1 Tax=Orrella sp. 11846 TaxID=3409913 RepID=UPI003B5A9097
MTATPLSDPRTASLLIELRTEELPPKALQRLSDTFGQAIYDALKAQHLLQADSELKVFATPRRLAAHITHVQSVAADQPFTEKLMPAKIGLDAQGQFTPALEKRLAAKSLAHLTPQDITQVDEGKQVFLVASGTRPGVQLQACLQEIVQSALDSLPIPKVMRYQLADGQTTVSFVRPAHGLVALHADQIVPIEILGLTADRVTQGHRFLAPESFEIQQADDYESELAKRYVVASFQARHQEISDKLQAAASEHNATLGTDPAVDALLNEVTALVETVAIYTGEFESRFLDVPQECLILTMRLNQKYFPLFDPQTNKLTNRFLIVSNMPIDNPAHIIEGNERVIRPRLADAEFFYTTDSKQPLASRVAVLDNMVYHNKLGSEGERVKRLRDTASWIGRQLGADVALCDRAAELAKADLSTLMVGEFPELQGIIGGDYARHDQEPESVASAIAKQYQIRWTAPVTTNDLPGIALYMAERAQTLIGIWGIGLSPTGERDPFGLRRAALGLISAFEQLQAGGFLALTGEPVMTLEALLQATFQSFSDQAALAPETVAEVTEFVRERYRNQRMQSDNRQVVEAVFALPVPLEQIVARIAATQTFLGTPQAQSLAAANKRISNILKKVEGDLPDVNPNLMTEAAEQALHTHLAAVEPIVQAHMQEAAYTEALSALAALREPVDAFFETVMVMAPDEAVRQNRLALLKRLHQTMNQVADLSGLAT